jgi:serine/threonine-protein kinase
MGMLYRAMDLKLGRAVAIKLLARHLVSDETAKARFIREARAASALDHPNIATIYEIGEADGELFISMALYEGETLEQRRERGPLSVQEAVDVLRQVALGLEAAHRAGIVHRDIKPANILITRAGTIKILDFGVAKLVTDSQVQTQTGQTLGTVLYMSPEHLRGGAADSRSDLWSLGILAYEMLAGVSPFQAESNAATAMRILNDEPASLTTVPGIPDWLAQLVSELLRKNPTERPQTTSEVLRRLGGGDSGRSLPFQRSPAVEGSASLVGSSPSRPAELLPKPPGLNGWFAELKRRRVFRALVAYAIAAFAVLQIIEPIMHGAHWPEMVLSYVVAGLAAGFPIVITLAWVFDVKAGRIERTAPAAASLGPRGIRLALLLVGISVLAAAPGLAWYFVFRSDTRIVARRDGEPRHALEPKSVAVLPFVNMSSDKENEYFSDGMTEELINTLANVEGLRVASRTSAFAFKGKDIDIRQIGEKLNVGTVLEGSVRREGNTLRVTAQLIQVSDGYHLWSKSYDRELKSLFALEEDIARSIADALQRKLMAVKAATTNLDAHDLYLRGLYFLNRRTKSALAKAAEYFEQAIAQDPRYALAYVGLADATMLQTNYGAVAPVEILPRAKAAALRALALDPALAEAHTSMGNIYGWDYELSAALQEFRTALALKPDYATGHHWYGQVLLNLGKVREAQAELDRAMELDPASSIIKVARAYVLVYARDYQGALAQFKKVLELDPEFNPVHGNIAGLYLLQGKYSEALAEAEKVHERRDVYVQSWHARVYALSGRREESLELARAVEDRSRREYVSHVSLGLLWLALNDKDRAFAHFMKGCELRDGGLHGVKVNPSFDAARADPRFKDLLRCVHLE